MRKGDEVEGLPFAAFLNLLAGVSLIIAALGKSKNDGCVTVLSWCVFNIWLYLL